MSAMKLSEMKTNDELIAEQLRNDPAFRVEWERTALARAVAVAVVGYRAEHDLSQRELARRLGMKQPQVARLELGEVNPTIETLMRLASELRIEFTIDVKPVVKRVGQRKAGGDVRALRTPAVELVVSAK
jgi:ribosome-binding protein aMBF1 (putative translation factor)